MPWCIAVNRVMSLYEGVLTCTLRLNNVGINGSEYRWGGEQPAHSFCRLDDDDTLLCREIRYDWRTVHVTVATR